MSNKIRGSRKIGGKSATRSRKQLQTTVNINLFQVTLNMNGINTSKEIVSGLKNKTLMYKKKKTQLCVACKKFTLNTKAK